MNKIKNHLIALTAVLALVCTFALPTASASKDLTYTTIDFPGAIFTGAFGIGPSGDVVGFYRDTANKQHGFLLSGEGFTTIDFPGAALTDARGIAPDGTIVGVYRYPGEPPLVSHGYLRTPDGLLQQVNYPGHISTIPQRIQPNGAILGCYHDTDNMGTMHGIVMSPAGNSELDVEATMHTGSTPAGSLIVGLYTDMTGKARGYVVENGVFTGFDYPGAHGTNAWDVNARGSIVGVYQDSALKFHGFLWEKGEFSSIDVPGASVTRAFGINARGDIVGNYVDASNRTHAYVASRTKPHNQE